MGIFFIVLGKLFTVTQYIFQNRLYARAFNEMKCRAKVQAYRIKENKESHIS